MTSKWDDVWRAADDEVERMKAEALLGPAIRRLFFRELEGAKREAFRSGLTAGIALQRRCQREHDTHEGGR